MSEAELFKAMENGQLYASEVLPKVAKEFKKAALEGGAYALALKGLRVTEGQMIKASQEAGDKIFKSGFSEGLSDLYKTIAELLKDSGPQLQKLGKIFGSVFKGIAKAIEVLTPILKFAIDHFGALVSTYMISRLGILIGTISKMSKAMKVFGAVSAISWAAALAPITALLASFGLIDDWLGQFDRNVINSDEKSRGYQIIDGQRVGVEQRKGKWYDTGKVLPNQGENYWLHSKISGMLGDNSTANQPQKVELTVTGLPSYLNTTIRSEMDVVMSGGMLGESG